MKCKPYIAIVAALTLVVSCRSDVEAPPGAVFLKSIDLGEDYTTLSAFGLDDGSVIMTLWGGFTSDLIKVDRQGNLLWRSDISGNVWYTWAGVLLSNGNILVYGFDGENNNREAGAVIFSPEGELMHSVTFLNQTGNAPADISYSLDGMELSNGDIALVMPVITAAAGPTRVRLMRFDQSLELISSRIYQPDSVVPNVSTRQISLTQDRHDNLLVQGRVVAAFDAPDIFAFVMKLEKDTDDPVYFQQFEGDFVTIPSNVAAADDGAAVWASAGPTPISEALIGRFTMLGEKRFSIGTEIVVRMSNGPDEEVITTVIRGFPKFGFIENVRVCSDGGFMLSGTCNFNSNQEIPGDYRVLLVKLDSRLNVQWMRVPDTHSAAVCADAIEVDGGFLVSGSHFGYREYNNPFLFKIDFEGNIY